MYLSWCTRVVLHGPKDECEDVSGGFDRALETAATVLQKHHLALPYPPRGTRVGPTWDPDGPPNPRIPYGIHGGLVGYVAASRSLSRGVGAAPGEPGGTATFADETYGLPKYTSD